MNIKNVFILFCLSPFLIESKGSIRKPRMTREYPTADKKFNPYKPLKPNFKPKPPIQYKKKKSGEPKIRKGLQGYRIYTPISQSGYAELQEVKEIHKAAKNWDLASKYLHRMIVLCDNINEKAILIIELADILFLQQKYDDAIKWYTEFTQLYPGNKHLEYASYKAIVCSSKKILSSDRDQSPTEKTLELTDTFLKRSDIFQKYRQEV